MLLEVFIIKYGKRLLYALTFIFSLGLTFGGTNVHASRIYSYTPKAIHGSYYRYLGHKQWTKLSISTHKVRYADPTTKAVLILTPHAKSTARRLAYQSNGKSQGRTYFTLDAELKSAYKSILPENGFSLTYRQIRNKKVKVIRGYQGGYWFDYLKNTKFTHDYSGIANGKY